MKLAKLRYPFTCISRFFVCDGLTQRSFSLAAGSCHSSQHGDAYWRVDPSICGFNIGDTGDTR